MDDHKAMAIFYQESARAMAVTADAYRGLGRHAAAAAYQETARRDAATARRHLFLMLGFEPENVRGPVVHTVKSWPESFAMLLAGCAADIRRDDRDYQAGDVIIFEEFDPGSHVRAGYSGRELHARITHVKRGRQYELHGLEEGFCALSIKARVNLSYQDLVRNARDAVQQWVDWCNRNEADFSGWGDHVVPPGALLLTETAEAVLKSFPEEEHNGAARR
jgi:hypothetical protein